MSYTSIQLLVPIQYVAGVAATQTDSLEMPFFDNNPDTEYNMSTFGDCDLTISNGAVATWLFVDGDSQYRNTGVGYYNVEGDGGALALGTFHAEIGETSYWTFDSAKFYRNNTHTTGALNALVKLTNSTSYTKYGIDIISTMSPSGSKRGYLFSKNFAVPPYNIGHKQTESFKTSGERTQAGNDFSNWILAADSQVIVIHEFTWTNLNDAYKLVFDNFIKAFNGNIKQPFVMVRMTDSGTTPNFEMEFFRLVPQDATLRMQKDKSDLWTFTLTAQEQLVNY